MTFDNLSDSERTAVLYWIKDAVHSAWKKKEAIRNNSAREMIPVFFMSYLDSAKREGKVSLFVSEHMIKNIEKERFEIPARQIERIKKEQEEEKAWLLAAEAEGTIGSREHNAKVLRLQAKYR